MSWNDMWAGTAYGGAQQQQQQQQQQQLMQQAVTMQQTSMLGQQPQMAQQPMSQAQMLMLMQQQPQQQYGAVYGQAGYYQQQQQQQQQLQAAMGYQQQQVGMMPYAGMTSQAGVTLEQHPFTMMQQPQQYPPQQYQQAFYGQTQANPFAGGYPQQTMAGVPSTPSMQQPMVGMYSGAGMQAYMDYYGGVMPMGMGPGSGQMQPQAAPLPPPPPQALPPATSLFASDDIGADQSSTSSTQQQQAEAQPPPPPASTQRGSSGGTKNAGAGLARPLPLGMKPGGSVDATDIFLKPGRLKRPDRICLILRGIPGSGKSYLAKMIRDIEKQEGQGCRILCLDDYFLQEVVKEEKDENGVLQKVSVLEYQYEQEMEAVYMQSYLRAFKKTLDERLFKVVIVDSIMVHRGQYEDFWSYAKSKGCEVYIVDMPNDVRRCVSRNVHGWDEKALQRMVRDWEPTPEHMTVMHVSKFLGEKSEIEDVDMDADDDDDVVVIEPTSVTVPCEVLPAEPEADGLKVEEAEAQSKDADSREEEAKKDDAASTKRSRWESDDDDQQSEDEERERMAQQLASSRRRKRGLSAITEPETPKDRPSKSVRFADPLDDLATYEDGKDLVGSIKRQNLEHLKGMGMSAAEFLRRKAQQQRDEANERAQRLSFLEKVRKEQCDFKKAKSSRLAVGPEDDETPQQKVPWTRWSGSSS